MFSKVENPILGNFEDLEKVPENKVAGPPQEDPLQGLERVPESKVIPEEGSAPILSLEQGDGVSLIERAGDFFKNMVPESLGGPKSKGDQVLKAIDAVNYAEALDLPIHEAYEQRDHIKEALGKDTIDGLDTTLPARPGAYPVMEDYVTNNPLMAEVISPRSVARAERAAEEMTKSPNWKRYRRYGINRFTPAEKINFDAEVMAGFENIMNEVAQGAPEGSLAFKEKAMKDIIASRELPEFVYISTTENPQLFSGFGHERFEPHTDIQAATRAFGISQRQIAEAMQGYMSIQIPTKKLIRAHKQPWLAAIWPHLRLKPYDVLVPAQPFDASSVDTSQFFGGGQPGEVSPPDPGDSFGFESESELHSMILQGVNKTFGTNLETDVVKAIHDTWRTIRRENDRLAHNLLSVGFDMTASTVAFVEMLNFTGFFDEELEAMKSWAKEHAEEARPPRQETAGGRFIDDVERAFASTATFFLPSVGVMKMASLLKMAPQIAALTGQTFMSVFESAVEAGEVYDTVVERTGDKTKAFRAGAGTFLANLPVLFFTNRLTFFGGAPGIKGQLGRRGLGFLSEGGQEGFQGTISRYFKDEPIKLKDIGYEFLLGGIVGGVMATKGPDPRNWKGAAENDIMTDEGRKKFIEQLSHQPEPRSMRSTPDTINEIVKAGLTTEGVALLAKEFMKQDPTLTMEDALVFSDRVGVATQKMLDDHNMKLNKGEIGVIAGETVTAIVNQVRTTAIHLMKGHDADTLVEEWFHRSWFNTLTTDEQAAFTKYHEESGDKRSVQEHFAQEGRDVYFAQGLHKKAGTLEKIFQGAVDSLNKLVARIATIKSANIPREIMAIYLKAAEGGKVNPIAEDSALLGENPESHPQIKKVQATITQNKFKTAVSRIFKVSKVDYGKGSKKEALPEIIIDTWEKARFYNAHPERVSDFQQMYDEATRVPVKQKDPATDGKLIGVHVVSLTQGCQRIAVTLERVENGILPAETLLEACYGGDCWVNWTLAQRYQGSEFENMEARPFELTTPEAIREYFYKITPEKFKVWKLKKDGSRLKNASRTLKTQKEAEAWIASQKDPSVFVVEHVQQQETLNQDRVDKMNNSEFIRMGFYGDDSHAIASGLAVEWLKTAREAGITVPTVFISAGYAPVTDEQYAELAPYNDIYELHISQSGWFSKNEIMLRLGEYMAAKAAGANASMRIITNNDVISDVEFINADFLHDLLLNQMKIPQEDLLETPYHDDKLPEEEKYSTATGLFKNICCKTRKCQSCNVKCMALVKDLDPDFIEVDEVRNQQIKAIPYEGKFTAAELVGDTVWEALPGEIHAEIINRISDEFGIPYSEAERMAVDGFTTDDGTFVTRKQAKQMVGLDESFEMAAQDKLSGGIVAGGALDIEDLYDINFGPGVEYTEEDVADLFSTMDNPYLYYDKAYEFHTASFADSIFEMVERKTGKPRPPSELERMAGILGKMERSQQIKRVEISNEAWESMLEDVDESFNWWYERYANKGDEEKIAWAVVPDKQIERVWEAFAETGIVTNEKVLQKIEDILYKNIVRMRSMRTIAGRDMLDRAIPVGHPMESWEEDEWDKFFDWAAIPVGHNMYTLPYTDFAQAKLERAIMSARATQKPEEKIIYLDEVLNVIHQTSDLARFFVQSGRQFLDDLSSSERNQQIKNLPEGELLEEIAKNTQRATDDQITTNAAGDITAEFAFHWDFGVDTIPVAPMYTVLGNTEFHGSTVGLARLAELGIPTPKTPPFKGNPSIETSFQIRKVKAAGSPWAVANIVNQIKNPKQRIHILTGKKKPAEVEENYRALKEKLKIEEKAGRIASTAVRRELREAQRARNRVKKAIDGIKKLKKDIKTIKNQDDRAPVEELLAPFDTVKMSDKLAVKTRKTEAWLRSQPEGSVELPDRVWVNLDRLDQTALSDLAVEQIEDLLNTGKHMFKLAKAKSKYRLAKEERDYKKDKDEILRSFKKKDGLGKPVVVADTLFKKIKAIGGPVAFAKRALTNVNNYLLGHDMIVRDIAGADSLFYRIFKTNIREAVNEEARYKQLVDDEFQLWSEEFEANNQIDSIPAWLEEDVESLILEYDDNGNKIETEFPLTRGEKLSLYMMLKNENSRRHVLKGGIGKRTSFFGGKTRHYSFKNDADVVAFLESFTTEEVQFVEGKILDIFKAQGELLNKKFKEANGYEIALEEDYYPINVMTAYLYDSGVKDASELRKTGTGYQRVGAPKGMTKERVKSSQPVFLDSIGITVQASRDMVAAYTGLEIPLSTASKFLFDPDIQRAIEDIYGEGTFKLLVDNLGVTAGRYNYGENMGNFSKFFASLRLNFTVARLGYNIFVMMKQPLSFPHYWEYVRGGYLFETLYATNKQFKAWQKEAIKYMPSFKDRINAFDRDMADVRRQAQTKKPTRLFGKNGWRERFMAGIGAFDRWTVVRGIHAAVEDVLDQIDSGELRPITQAVMDQIDPSGSFNIESTKGMTSDQLKTLAYRYAEIATDETQPASTPLLRSKLSTGNELGKQLSMFTGFTSRQYTQFWRMMAHYKETGDKGPLTRYFIAYAMGATGIYGVNALKDVLMGRGDEDENAFINFFVHMLFSIPATVVGLRDIFSQFGPGTPYTDAVEGFQKSAKALSKAITEPSLENTIRFFDKSLGSVLNPLGIPYAPITDPIRAVSRAAKPKKSKNI